MAEIQIQVKVDTTEIANFLEDAEKACDAWLDTFNDINCREEMQLAWGKCTEFFISKIIKVK